MKKAWRVSISNRCNGCYNCGNHVEDHEKIINSGDYCGSCQHVTVDYVDQRGDYGDVTVGYYDTEQEAQKVADSLVPFAD